MRSHESKQLTKKQAYWLKHLRECAASGQRLATYAVSHDLKPQRLYNWKSRLQTLGVWKPSETVRSKRPRMKPAQMRRHSRPVELSFIAARVAAAGPPALATGMRIRFPNGVTLEVGSSVQATPDARLLTLLAALP